MAEKRDRRSSVIALLAVAVTCSAASNVLVYVAMSDRVASERELREESTALLERCLESSERLADGEPAD
ncbi:MAG TPA: hypothetical protein RMH99_05855 [Sandaracinaceae bacterium LLY-WYZ-13_1]|nr:hypothetical protein [Sandaracinaceae bacterium LLY-WYZ-13_1]